jgi:hypothetical protein
VRGTFVNQPRVNNQLPIEPDDHLKELVDKKRPIAKYGDFG